ncbi:hypothetical protein DFS33DRAFT_1387967 [Desarmillaria ectypa]|nr:hypothetical protein DFS33DRAFT_1387967 [Desarmillaria ectypa]
MPPEIIDEIIDYLSNDASALVSCSSVCRLFYPRTRKHIFRSIYFGGFHRKPIVRFVDMVNGSPNLLSCVTNMEIHKTATYLSLGPLLPSMVNLTSLKIAFIRFSSGNDFHAPILKILRLKELSLFWISSPKRKLPIEVPNPCSGPALERIRIEGGDKKVGLLPSFLQVGLRAVYIDALQYLELALPAEEDLRALCEILHVARSLRHVILSAVQFTLRRWPSPATLPLMGLESFAVELFYQNNNERTDICLMRWLAASLYAISKPSSLRTLDLKVILFRNHQLREDDGEMWLLCTRLDGALQRAELAQLRQLTIRILGNHLSEDAIVSARALTISRFPLALKRGILVVTDNED